MIGGPIGSDLDLEAEGAPDPFNLQYNIVDARPAAKASTNATSDLHQTGETQVRLSGHTDPNKLTPTLSLRLATQPICAEVNKPRIPNKN